MKIRSRIVGRRPAQEKILNAILQVVKKVHGNGESAKGMSWQNSDSRSTSVKL